MAPHRAEERILVGLEVATGALGLAGGLMLAARPDGSLLRAQMSALSGSPFTDWRTPGILLACLVGGGFVGAATWQFQKLPHARALSIVAGGGLVVFELCELAWIGFQPLEIVFGLMGAAVVVLATRQPPLARGRASHVPSDR